MGRWEDVMPNNGALGLPQSSLQRVTAFTLALSLLYEISLERF